MSIFVCVEKKSIHNPNWGKKNRCNMAFPNPSQNTWPAASAKQESAKPENPLCCLPTCQRNAVLAMKMNRILDRNAKAMNKKYRSQNVNAKRYKPRAGRYPSLPLCPPSLSPSLSPSSNPPLNPCPPLEPLSPPQP